MGESGLFAAQPFAEEYRLTFAFLTSVGVGLLIGLERERHAEAKAGVRTFALIAMLGTLTVLIAEQSGSAWIIAAGLIVVGGTVLAAYLADRKPSWDSGTTTVVAAAVTYSLGVAIAYGFVETGVALAILVTALLYFKTEIEGFQQSLTPVDYRSLLQFAALSLVVLPVLPDEGYGPYGALNPRNIGYMVVLISAVSFTGYVASRVLRARADPALLGAIGGLVSSTATTLVYSREARGRAGLASTAIVVILLANLVMVVRVGLLSLAASPSLLPTLAVALGATLAAGLPFAYFAWRQGHERGALAAPEFTNPTNLRVALGFGAAYALILLASAWLSEVVGEHGLYLLAIVSGLTDVDAISLSAMRLHEEGRIAATEATTTIALAIASNFVTKAGIVFATGGAALGRRSLAAFSVMALALFAGVALVRP